MTSGIDQLYKPNFNVIAQVSTNVIFVDMRPTMTCNDVTTGSWTCKLLQPLGVQLPLDVMKIDVLFWSTLDGYENICTANSDDGRHHGDNCMGVFINCEDDKEIHFYGIPAYEYPGLVKVRVIIVITHTYYCVYNCWVLLYKFTKLTLH